MDTREERSRCQVGGEHDDPNEEEFTVVDREATNALRTLEGDTNTLGNKGESNTKKVNSLSKIADELLSATPVISNVAVANSENVHFGNNTYFSGPVVIKQLIQSNTDLEISAYTKTKYEDNNAPINSDTCKYAN